MKPICAPMMRSSAVDSCFTCPFRLSCPAFKVIKSLRSEVEELMQALEEV